MGKFTCDYCNRVPTCIRDPAQIPSLDFKIEKKVFTSASQGLARTATCQRGSVALGCGISVWPKSLPPSDVSFTQDGCECYMQWFRGYCWAICANQAILDKPEKISAKAGEIATCPTGSYVTGCASSSLVSTAQLFTNYEPVYQGCKCDAKVPCTASCVRNVKRHSIQSYSKHGTNNENADVVCPSGTIVLGCGRRLDSYENHYDYAAWVFKPLNATACRCSFGWTATCYAICGYFDGSTSVSKLS